MTTHFEELTEMQKSRNKTMAIAVIIVAFVNIAMLYGIGKPFNLIFTIFVLALSLGIFTLLMVRLKYNSFASWFYSFGICFIIQIYTIIDKQQEDILFLFVCIFMSSFFMNWRIVLFTTFLSCIQIPIDFYFFNDIFPIGYKISNSFYYIFSFMAAGGVIGYQSFLLNKQMKFSLLNEKKIKEDSETLKSNFDKQKQTLNILSDFASSLKSTIHATNEAYQETSETFQSSNAAIMEQNDSLIELSSNIESIKEGNDQILSSVDELNKNNDRSGKEVNEHKKDVDNLESSIHYLKQTFSENVSISQSLVIQTEKIKEFLDKIGEISERTDILALNANIEASHAGIHGRGFSVVANEVKVLASNTHKYVEDIQSLIEDIQNTVESNKNKTLNSDHLIDATLQNSSKVKNVFDVILHNVHGIQEETKVIMEKMKEQNLSLGEISNRTNDINQISEENTMSLSNIENNLSNIQEKINFVQQKFDNLQKTIEKM